MRAGLRVVVPLLAVAVPVLAHLAGGRDVVVLDVLVLGAALVAAWLPDSPAGLVLLLTLALDWLAARPMVTSPLVLLAAAALVVVHVVTHVAAQGPRGTPVDVVQLRRWAPRAGAAWLASVGCWLALRAAYDGPRLAAVHVAGLVVLAGGALLVAARLGRAAG